MGQYFKPAIETASGEQFTIGRTGSSKMMEWGYLENTDLALITKIIKELTANGELLTYIHVGDYSELKPDAYDYPVNEELTAKYDEMMQLIEGGAEDDPTLFNELIAEQNTYYLYNHTKREMVCINDYSNAPHNWEPSEGQDDGWAIHPLAILCCTEQGLGGGDYYYCFEGKQLEEGGRWLGDKISVSDTKMIGFEDISLKMRLTADEATYKEIINDPSLEAVSKAYSVY